MSAPRTESDIRGNRRVLFGWAMYDWANSAYVTTIVVALLPIYFAGVVVPKEGVSVFGAVVSAEALWAFMVSAAAFFVFLAAPALGAIADFASAKKRLLLIFCYAGVTSALLLYFCREGDVWPTVVLFLVSQIGFVGANVFYDGFLPQIAPEGKEDWVSSRGFAYGYVGGGLQFALALGLIAGSEKLGIDEPTAARIGMLTAALWWGGFALVTAFLLREPRAEAELPERYADYPIGLGYVAVGFSRVWATTRRVGRFKPLLLFLIAFMIYNDGIQTVINMATMYGKQELGLSATDLMVTLLVIQFVAFFGAYLFAWIADRLDAKRAIMLALGAWSGVVLYAFFIDSAREFFVLGVVVGIVLGGSQSLSRSLYAAMIPERASAEFFGFYSVFNKFSAIWGPLVFGIVRQWTGSLRNAIVSLVVFFVLGILLLSRVRVENARAAHDSLDF